VLSPALFSIEPDASPKLLQDHPLYFSVTRLKEVGMSNYRSLDAITTSFLQECQYKQSSSYRSLACALSDYAGKFLWNSSFRMLFYCAHYFRPWSSKETEFLRIFGPELIGDSWMNELEPREVRFQKSARSVVCVWRRQLRNFENVTLVARQ